MTKKKKIIIGAFVLVLIGLLFFEGRSITFSMECFSAETELEKNFSDNKNDFIELAKLWIAPNFLNLTSIQATQST